MTQFEFVTVALSLIYALAVSDVVRCFPWAARSPARYWPHFGWLVVTLLIITFGWHSTWNLRNVSWNGLQFLYALQSPILISVVARVLTTRTPETVVSYREHFAVVRRPLYGLVLATAIVGSISPWVQGNIPFGTIAPIHYTSAPAALLMIGGLTVPGGRSDGLLAGLLVVALLTGLAFVPTRGLNVLL